MSRQTEAMDKALSQITDALGFKICDFEFSRPGIQEGFVELLDLRANDFNRGKFVWVQTFIHHIGVIELHNRLAVEKFSETFSFIGIADVDPLFSNDYGLSFTKVSEIPAVLNEIERLFNNKFLGFYKEYEDLERILDYYNKNHISLERRFYILPLLYALTGRPEKGIEVMEPLLRFGLVPDGNCRHYYQNYCDHIKQYL